MEFQKLIEERRTIRKYSPESRITKEDLLAVIRAALEAPSWKNSQTGRYYCVMSEEMVEKVSRECLPDNELGNGWGCYDLGLQNENLILKAKELGYGTLIMGLRAGDKLREILSIPETETVMAVIAIGKAAEEPARPKRKDVEDIVRFY